MNQKAKNIVAEAWNITQNYKGLIKYGFISSLFSLSFGAPYYFYQIYVFSKKAILHEKIAWLNIFEIITNFVQNYQTLSFWLILLAVIIFTGSLIIPMICEGIITYLVYKIKKKEYAEHGIAKTFFNLLHLIEVSGAKKIIKPTSFLILWSFIYRNLGIGFAKLLSPLIILLIIIGFFGSFLFVMTTPLVMINKNIFAKAIKNSSKLVMKNFSTTISLFLIFLFIELRVVLNVLVILFLPFIVVAVTGLFATLLSQTALLILSIIIAIILLFFTAFLTGALTVFSDAIWTIAFLTFAENDEDID